jgi:uncharacterized membrane-anchored protein
LPANVTRRITWEPPPPTTVGETGADYLAVHVGLGATITDAIMSSLLIAALLIQLRVRRYVPGIYWLTVVLVSVVGTQITDALTDGFGVSLYTSTAVFAAALATTFAIWYGVERTLSIHTIYTTRREIFYWSAVLLTFALGTAAGDLATEELGLGFNLGVFVFGALIAAIAAAYTVGANAVMTFWLAHDLHQSRFPYGHRHPCRLSKFWGAQLRSKGAAGFRAAVRQKSSLTLSIVFTPKGDDHVWTQPNSGIGPASSASGDAASRRHDRYDRVRYNVRLGRSCRFIETW